MSDTTEKAKQKGRRLAGKTGVEIRAIAKKLGIPGSDRLGKATGTRAIRDHEAKEKEKGGGSG